MKSQKSKISILSRLYSMMGEADGIGADSRFRGKRNLIRCNIETRHNSYENE